MDDLILGPGDRTPNWREDDPILVFRDQSRSFRDGFICGKIWQQMRERSAPFSETVPAELREDMIAMATAAGWMEEFIELSDEWLRVTFMRDHTHAS